MRRLPIRKCYHIAKLGVICLIVITIVTLFEHWRGGKRSARAAYLNSVDDDFERQIQEDEARIRPGLGEGGIASHLDGEEKRLGEETVKKLAVNVYLSDLIPYNRTLKDYRNPACERVVYDAELPSASVILIFHNEPYSVVVRTIWSVVNSARRDQSWYKHANFVDREGKRMNLGYPGQDPSSPFVYLKEIVLVDDNSTLPELKGKLSHYIRTRLPPDLIKILRLPDRQGLMKARMRGARSARGDVLIFLDAHCEAAADWLRPLLQRIKHKRDAVVTPLIDVVDQDTFQLDAAEYFQVGGFTFNGHFTWIEIPEREKKRRGSNIAPTWSPTMAGGLFAMKRDYYWELGAYDEQMAGWGGENLEMSFRIWQCGGTLETVPCSRVGHVFRSFHPYGLPANSDTHGINTARMAEVWMDDYKELFYLHRPDLRKSPKIGDVTHRKILREKLKCKSFQWYLDNIYKEKFVPVRDVYGFGRFSNPASGLCLDTLQREGEASPLGVYPCHGSLMATQYLSLSLSGQLRDEEKCAELEYRRSSEVDDDGRKVLMVSCRNKMRGQRWRVLPDGQIQHMASQLCLDAGTEPGADVLATRCRRAAPAQRWNIDYSESNDFKLASNIEPSEQEMKLRALRKKSRRISRSLLSVDNNDIDTGDANNTTILRSHKHKKRRRSKKHKSKKHGKSVKRTKMKNKFILKILRTLMNDTEEHLEVDVYCKHHQLFPNNTFVRDLVTILNANNIKVINNGRVFERNKVTDIQASDAIKENEKKVVDKIHVEEFQQNDITTARNLDKSTKKRRKKPLPLSEVNEETAPLDAAQSDKKKIIIEDNTLLDTASDNKKIIIEDKSPLDAAVSDNKKIIIEDFVAIKPVDATTEANKRRRRKRKRTRARPAPPPTAALRDGDGDSGGDRDGDRGREEHYVIKIGDQESEEDTAKAPPPKSVSIEDTPMALSQEATPVKDRSEKDNAAERDDGDNELWSIGESRFRGNKSLATRRRSTRPIVEPDVDTQQQPLESVRLMSTASPGRGPPVKVVMRSNLTFNLGDDFFAWRRHNLDDAVADVLEELIIPTNLSSALRPRVPPRVLPRTLPRALPRASRRPSTRSDSDQSSSSSESASGDT